MHAHTHANTESQTHARTRAHTHTHTFQILCELLPNLHIRPLCHSRFFHVMIQCALDVVSGVLY